MLVGGIAVDGDCEVGVIGVGVIVATRSTGRLHATRDITRKEQISMWNGFMPASKLENNPILKSQVDQRANGSR